MSHRQPTTTGYSKLMGTKGVQQLYQQLSWSDLPIPELEYRFAPPRKWRFDLAYPMEKIGIEYDGGIYTYKPSHMSATNVIKQMYKLNTAQLMGWIVFRFGPKDVTSGYALRTVEAAFNGQIFLNTPDQPHAGPLEPPSIGRSPIAKGAR